MSSGTPTTRLAATALAFFAAAALTRFVLRHVESRVQILGYLALAVLFEAARRRTGGHRWTTRALIDAATAAVAIVAVKSYLEGTPF